MRVPIYTANLLLASFFFAMPAWSKPPKGDKKKAPEPSVSASTRTLPGLDVATAPANAAELINRFEAIDRQLTALAARYRQTVRFEDSGISQHIEGRIEYLKPDRLRIEHTRPERQTVVSDGKSIWVHRHSSNQVIHSALADWRKADPTLSSLLDFGTYANLAKRYEVAYSSGAREATLTPREKDAKFKLVLRLAPDTFFPVETELVLSSMRVRTELDQLQFNPELKESSFVFTPPPGADVFRDFKPPRLQP